MTKEYNDYYTYAYLREDKTPYYIGKGRGRRVYSTSRLIKPPADRSRILFLKKNLTEEEAFKHEIYMIAILGRKDLGTGMLRNLTNGGEGSSGAVRSSEQRKAHSEKMSGEKNPMFGVPRTEAQKKAHSEKLRGRTLTKEQKKKISEASAGRTHTEKAKKKCSESKIGEKNPNYGRTGALHPQSKAIIAIEPDGTQRHFGSGVEAAQELGMDPSDLSKYARSGHVLIQGRRKGWRFIDKNSEVLN